LNRRFRPGWNIANIAYGNSRNGPRRPPKDGHQNHTGIAFNMMAEPAFAGAAIAQMTGAWSNGRSTARWRCREAYRDAPDVPEGYGAHV
jgi:hypothetical protein